MSFNTDWNTEFVDGRLVPKRQRTCPLCNAIRDWDSKPVSKREATAYANGVKAGREENAKQVAELKAKLDHAQA